MGRGARLVCSAEHDAADALLELAEVAGPVVGEAGGDFDGADHFGREPFGFLLAGDAVAEAHQVVYALDSLEHAVMKETVGAVSTEDTETTIRELGLKYQLVTDYTSMVVLSDGDFTRRGIGRTNKQRVEVEEHARSSRGARPQSSSRADAVHPMFNGPAYSTKGAGPFDPLMALFACVAVFAVLRAGSRRGN